MIIKTEQELQGMCAAGECAAWVLNRVKQAVKVGISTYELDQIAKEAMGERGAVSAAYGYGDKKNPFPSYICISINNEVVHGIGRKERFLNEGDIVSLDVALHYKDYVGDNTCTIGVGKISKEATQLISFTEQALYKGIDQARAGNHVGDISWAIQSFGEQNHLGVVRELVGHGVGHAMHEEPQVPNVGRAGQGPLLKEGMVIAIEPMLTQGSPAIKTLSDGWTIVTKDGKLCAHAEHTVLITKDSAEILTKLKN